MKIHTEHEIDIYIIMCDRRGKITWEYGQCA